MSRHHSNFPTDSCWQSAHVYLQLLEHQKYFKILIKKIKSLQNILDISQVGSYVLKRSEFLTLNCYNPIHSTQNVKRREITEILEDT